MDVRRDPVSRAAAYELRGDAPGDVLAGERDAGVLVELREDIGRVGDEAGGLEGSNSRIRLTTELGRFGVVLPKTMRSRSSNPRIESSLNRYPFGGFLQTLPGSGWRMS